MNSWYCYKDEELIKQLDNEYLQVCLKVDSEYPLEDEDIKANIASLIFEYLDNASSQLLFSEYDESVYKNATKKYKRSEERLKKSISDDKPLTKTKLDKTMSDIEKLRAIEKKGKRNEFLLEAILNQCQKTQTAYIRRNFASVLTSLQSHFIYL